MTAATAVDRLRTLIDVLIASVDDPGTGEELAGRAHLSRFHFDRLVSAALGESPAAFRRRILLERAASRLATSDRPATEIALEAGYASLEAFTRAFGRTFGVSPSRFRALGTREFRVDAPNGVHFHPPGGMLVPGDDRRRGPMDFTHQMVEQDSLLTRRLLDSAAGLPEAALDEPVPLRPLTPAFREDAPTIRSMLNRLVFTKEMWTAAMDGRAFEEADDTSVDGMRARYEHAGPAFVALVRDIGRRDAWDTAFVDAT
jgi:AraC-like DNA-binding protein